MLALIDIASATFLDASGHPIENIATSGVIMGPTTMHISYPDRLPHAFVASDKQESIFKTPADAAKATDVEFELFAYDCRQLVSTDYLRAAVVYQRKTIKVRVTRRTP